LIYFLGDFNNRSDAIIYKWTNGNAIVATGSPFRDLDFTDRPLKVGQGNNALIFPGVGLGTLTVGASTITDCSSYSIASGNSKGKPVLQLCIPFYHPT